jgi:hypothetical protein
MFFSFFYQFNNLSKIIILLYVVIRGAFGVTWFFSSTWKIKIKILMHMIKKKNVFHCMLNIWQFGAIEESEFKWVHQQPLWKLCIICVFKYWSPFNQYCYHIFLLRQEHINFHYTPWEVVILHLEIVGHNKNILIKFTFSICNH